MPAPTPSSKFSTPAVLIVLLAALGIGPPLLNLSSRPSNAQAAPSPAAVTRPSSEGAALGRHSAAALLDDFFDNNSDQTSGDEPWSRDEAPSTTPDRRWSAGDARNDYAIAFLIATLPAPASPPLRYEFDAFLDAVQLALGRAGYVLDSFDLPSLKHGASGASDEADSNGNGKAHAAGAAHSGGSESGPGVLLFHRARGKRLLVLFVVGETPTRGVDKSELHGALDQIGWLAGWKAPNDPARPFYLDALARGFREGNEVRIVGPTFSGSAVSIRATLDDWFNSAAGKDRFARIVSGTATSVDDELSDPQIIFSTVRIPDSAILPVLVDDLEKGVANLVRAPEKLRAPDSNPASGPAPQIAILSDNTAYGRAAGSARGILPMTFPLHISDLRTSFRMIVVL